MKTLKRNTLVQARRRAEEGYSGAPRGSSDAPSGELDINLPKDIRARGARESMVGPNRIRVKGLRLASLEQVSVGDLVVQLLYEPCRRVLGSLILFPDREGRRNS